MHEFSIKTNELASPRVSTSKIELTTIQHICFTQEICVIFFFINLLVPDPSSSFLYEFSSSLNIFGIDMFILDHIQC